MIDVSLEVYRCISTYYMNIRHYFLLQPKNKKCIDYTYLLPLMLFRSLGPHLQHIERKAVSMLNIASPLLLSSGQNMGSDNHPTIG